MLGRSRFRRFFVKTAFFVFAVYLVAHYFYFAGWKRDISHDAAIKPWINTEFELKQEVFMFRYRGGADIYFDITGNNSDLATSVERFKENPDYFQYGYGAHDWICPLKSGTRLRITKVYLFEQPLVGRFLEIEVMPLLADKQDLRLLAYFAFRKEVYPPTIIGPKPNILEQVD